MQHFLQFFTWINKSMASIIRKWWCNFNYPKLCCECSKSFAHVIIIISLNAIFLEKSQWIEVPISLTAFAMQCMHFIECGRWFTLMNTHDSFHKTELSGMSVTHWVFQFHCHTNSSISSSLPKETESLCTFIQKIHIFTNGFFISQFSQKRN